ncbi:MAG: MFS transporter [Deltaproteobacteria bacterium]|nr:MFS transporter [Deltaproteobacteria bacterium]
MRVARPWHWSLLNLPFGATGGFVAVTLGYIASQAGMSDAVVGGLVAMNLLPHTWKFCWAPVADITLTRKTWYVASNAVSCLTVLGMGFVPFEEGSLGLLQALIFFNSVAISFLGMAVEGLMASATPREEIGRAAGWFQAGNLGGSGLGGGAALLVAEHVSVRASFVSLAVILAGCTLALRLVPEAPRVMISGPLGRKLVTAIGEVLRDLWRMLASRRGIIALILCFVPLGAGAAQGLFSAIAGRWHASGNLVAITTGVLGGLVAAAGCLAGGWLSDRMRRQVAYALSGVVLAVIAALMALSPQHPLAYAVFTLLYSFGSGMVYGCFTGFVLEVIGGGAIATKYNALASLSNIPIWYMTLVAGWASERHGPVNMLFLDAAAGLAGLAVLVAAIAIVRPGQTPRRPERGLSEA